MRVQVVPVPSKPGRLYGIDLTHAKAEEGQRKGGVKDGHIMTIVCYHSKFVKVR